MRLSIYRNSHIVTCSSENAVLVHSIRITSSAVRSLLTRTRFRRYRLPDSRYGDRPDDLLNIATISLSDSVEVRIAEWNEIERRILKSQDTVMPLVNPYAPSKVLVAWRRPIEVER
jgi:hypothetical protein